MLFLKRVPVLRIECVEKAPKSAFECKQCRFFNVFLKSKINIISWMTVYSMESLYIVYTMIVIRNTKYEDI